MIDVTLTPTENGLPAGAQPWARDIEARLRMLTSLGKRVATNTDAAIAASGNAVTAARNLAAAHASQAIEGSRIPATIDVAHVTLTPSTYFNATTGSPAGRVDMQAVSFDVDVDGDPLVVAGFEVWGRLFYAEPDPGLDPTGTVGVDPGPPYVRLASGPSSSLQVNNLQVGARYQLRVRALSSAGIPGALSDDIAVDIPNAADQMLPPDAPGLSSSTGVLVATWNGKLGGAEPATQFRYVYAEVATHGQNGFTRMGGNLVRGGGGIALSDLAVGTAYDVRLVAVDSLGVATAPSAIATLAVQGVGIEDAAQDLLDKINAAIQSGTDAQTAANGKNKITYSASDPTGAGIEGDTWFKRSAAGVIIGQWSYTGGAWVSRSIDGAVLANIDAGKITVGQLDGKLIKAGSILTNQLLVGDFTNLLDDPAFVGGPINGVSPGWYERFGGTYIISNNVPAGVTWQRELRYDSKGSAADMVYMNTMKVPAKQGDVFYMEVGTRSSGAYQVGPVLWANLADGSMVAVDYFYGTTDGIKTKLATCPANTVSVQLSLVARGGIPNGGAATFYNPVLRRALTGNLIATGAIDGQTITGASIRTAATGKRAEMGPTGMKWYNLNGAQGGSIESITDSGGTGALLTVTGGATTLTLGRNDMPRAGTSDASVNGTFYAPTIYNGTGFALPTIYLGSFGVSTGVASGANSNTTVFFPTGMFSAPPVVMVVPGNARFTPGVSSVTTTSAVVSLSNWSPGAGIPGTCYYIAFGS